ncbi:MAG TPA: PfkB family carbohydrate kinase [Anaerolineaceae bacterium]|nr:PfkB family carbohydrate kinase [Anaerolineaceae bacterium]
MTQHTTIDPIDYLLIGHVTADLQADQSISLGGTASFSGLTAARLGHKVGLVTSCASDLQLEPLSGIQKWVIPSEKTTTFRNEGLGQTRVQHLYSLATRITADHIPATWRDCQLVHFGPIAAEIDPNIVDLFPNALVCLTPQGWYRQADEEGLVRHVDWPEGLALLERADAVVLSIEDLKGDESKVQDLSWICSLLVVTENREGARVFWKGRPVRYFSAPLVELVEDTGAGDIFAACFFHRLHITRDPWEAARFAVQLSACSVTRRRLQSVPTQNEIDQAKNQMLA